MTDLRSLGNIDSDVLQWGTNALGMVIILIGLAVLFVPMTGYMLKIAVVKWKMSRRHI